MPTATSLPLRLSARERAAVLAGLRLLQSYLADDLRAPEGIDLILTDGGAFRPLSIEAIDDLCARLNATA